MRVTIGSVDKKKILLGKIFESREVIGKSNHHARIFFTSRGRDNSKKVCAYARGRERERKIGYNGPTGGITFPTSLWRLASHFSSTDFSPLVVYRGKKYFSRHSCKFVTKS